MVAMAILGIGLLALGAVQLQAMTGVRVGRNTSQAAIIGQTEIERLQRESWVNLAPSAWSSAQVIESATDVGGTGHVQQSYSLSRRIVDLVPNTARSLDVRVTWTDAGTGIAKSQVFTSVRFNHEGL